MFDGRYVLWGGEHSLFTRKLQAMLNYLGVDYEFKLKSGDAGERMEARLGTHFIPGLETPEGWFVHDTTPIGLMLSAKYPERSVVPSAPVQRIASHLLEDWADEWFGRYAISSRWCYPHNIDHVAIGFYANFIGKYERQGLTPEELVEARKRIEIVRDQFGLNACTNRGCGPDQAVHVRRDFEQLMVHVERHYTEHPFLLGDRASLGDFTFAGLFKAHIASDPEPRSWILGCAPKMLELMDQVFEARAGEAQYLPDDALPPTLMPFFEHMRDSYHAFLRVSRDALAAGEKWCEVDLGEGPVRMRSLKYSEISRCHIKGEIESLSPADRAAVDSALGSLGVLDAYLLPAVLP
ncbi:MAG: glutathione S-transferase family protein [Pseudomonadaceae bacterium]|nr:glutathione S-transferase family protein [Pseudomonadaceae bacterium]